MYCFMYFGIASPFPSMDFFTLYFFVLNLIMEIELMVWQRCFSNTNARLRDTSWGNLLTLFESTKLTYNTHKKKNNFLLEVTAVYYKEKLSYSSWPKSQAMTWQELELNGSLELK